MSTTPWFPAPSADVCPACDAHVADGTCLSCGLSLLVAEAPTLWWVDSELHRLAEQRSVLLGRTLSLVGQAAAWSETQSPTTGRARTQVFPGPSVDVCPQCSGAVASGRCGRCGLVLDGELGSSLWEIDADIHRLTGQRRALLSLMRSQPPADPPVGPPAEPSPVPPAEAEERHTLQYLLLGLGALCLVVAAIAFGAVAWTRMGALAKGAVLASGTLAAAGLAATAHRRGLRATAEALAAVACVGAVVNIHAVRVGMMLETPGWKVWAVGTAVVALLAWAFDRAMPVVSARVAALVLSQVPGVLLASALLDRHLTLPLAILALQSALTLAALALGGSRLKPAVLRLIPAVSATLTWAFTVIASLAAFLLTGIDSGEAPPRGTMAVLAGCGLIAAGVAVAWRRSTAVRTLAAMAASVIFVLAPVLALTFEGPQHEAWLVASVAGAIVAVIGMALPSEFRPAPAVVGALATATSSLYALPALLAAVRLGGHGDQFEVWGTSATASARSFMDSSPERGFALAAIALLPVAAVLAAAWWRNLQRPLVAIGAAATSLAAVAVLPLALDLPVWCAAALPLLLGLAVVAFAAERDGSVRAVALPLGLVSVTVGAVWAIASPGVTIASVVAVLASAVAIAGSAVRREDEPIALSSTGVAMAATAGLAATIATAKGSTPDEVWTTVAVATAAASATGWLLASLASSPSVTAVRRRLLQAMGVVVEGAALAAHVVAVVVVAEAGNVDLLSLVMLAGAVAIGAHSTRPDRRTLVWPAQAEGLAVGWLRLADAQVTVVEAYSAPLALLLLAAGIAAVVRDRERGSWDTLGPGLALLLAPTVLLGVWGDPSVRPLIAVLAGTVVLLAGVRYRLQAAVTLGALTVGVVATRELLPAASGLPRFVVFGVIGCVLIAIGATFEQRRRDLVDLKDRFESLR